MPPGSKARDQIAIGMPSPSPKRGIVRRSKGWLTNAVHRRRISPCETRIRGGVAGSLHTARLKADRPHPGPLPGEREPGQSLSPRGLCTKTYPAETVYG